MAHWLEKLTGESQAQLLTLLRHADHSVSGLAARLGLSDNAVRTHINALERNGLIEPAGVQRDTGGKPARMYRLTAQGEELFPKAYATILGELTREIGRQEGPERALELLEAVGRRVAQSVAVSGDLEERVKSAAGLLEQLGGTVQVTADERGGWRLNGHGCPLALVTARHPEVCELARGLVQEITGGSVTECCDRSARPRCGFQIR